MRCPICHYESSPGFALCPNCGTPLERLTNSSPLDQHALPLDVPPPNNAHGPPTRRHLSSQSQRRREKGSLNPPVILLVLAILALGGVAVVGIAILHRPGVPDTSQISPGAASVITSAVSTNAIDTSSFEPIGQAQQFNINSTIYIAVTFSGRMGYALVELYRNGVLDVSSKILTVKSGDTNAAFSFQIDYPGQFVAGVYWCKHGNCGDQTLAQVVYFSAS